MRQLERTEHVCSGRQCKRRVTSRRQCPCNIKDWNQRLTLVATSMKSTPMVLLTKGKDLDARKLHSMTMQSVPLAMNCMLNGPVMFSRFATALVASCCRD